MNTVFSNVYILIYPHLNAIKVGKADNLFNRIQQLNHWGKPDLNISYMVEINKENVYKLEGALHLVLYPFKKIMDKKDGYTEFFDIEALDEVSKVLEFLKLDKIPISLKIEKKKVAIINDRKEIKFKNKIENRIELIEDNLQLLKSLKRGLILIKKRNFICKYNENDVLSVESRYLFLIKKKLIWLNGFKNSGAVISVDSGDKVSLNVKSVVDLFNENLMSDLFVYVDILLDCYNFLKKDLPNESELPVITLTKENKLIISS
ncbi:TPA: GIY-YIG nuclease family protein [Proteus mirabilis]